MAKDHLITALLTLVRPDQDRAVLPTFPDCSEQLVELGAFVFQAVLNEGLIDESRIKFDDGLALEELIRLPG
jgi:hypothetical protein